MDRQVIELSLKYPHCPASEPCDMLYLFSDGASIFENVPFHSLGGMTIMRKRWLRLKAFAYRFMIPLAGIAAVMILTTPLSRTNAAVTEVSAVQTTAASNAMTAAHEESLLAGTTIAATADATHEARSAAKIAAWTTHKASGTKSSNTQSAARTIARAATIPTAIIFQPPTLTSA